ncbi:hypothetical protein BDF19DRAFT_419878 [Syncephalis fuscata]|nr:hypothetical protein BDF19DRAFT_419878 [Syncephalis fuscata]
MLFKSLKISNLKEPIGLHVLRITTIIALTILLATYFAFQFCRTTFPSITARTTSIKTEDVRPPALVILTPNSFNDVATIETSFLSNINNALSPVVGNFTDDTIRPLTWGSNVIYTPLVSQKDASMAANTHNVWTFAPLPQWYFATNTDWSKLGYDQGFFYNETKPISFNTIRMAMQWQNSNKPRPIEIFVIDDIAKLKPVNNASKPLDLASLDPGRKCSITQGYDCRIQIRAYYKVTGQESKKSYSVDLSVTPTTFSNNGTITMESTNTPANDGSGAYLVQVRSNEPELYWLDFLSLLGGFTLLLTLFYTLLFGHQRLQTWGFVQRYLMRFSLLGRYPPQVVTINDKPSNLFYSTANLYSTLSSDLFQLASNNTDAGITPPGPALVDKLSMPTFQSEKKHPFPYMPSMASDITMVEQSKVEKLNAVIHTMSCEIIQLRNQTMKQQAQIDSLDNFRKRIESFYLSSNLFYTNQ